MNDVNTNEASEAPTSVGLTFPTAIALVKDGATVARAGWNGKGMFIYLKRGSLDRSNEIPRHIEGVPSHLFDTGDVGTVTRLPNLNMRSASGATVTGWLASQTDMLAEDWCVVEY